MLQCHCNKKKSNGARNSSSQTVKHILTPRLAKRIWRRKKIQNVIQTVTQQHSLLINLLVHIWPTILAVVVHTVYLWNEGVLQSVRVAKTFCFTSNESGLDNLNKLLGYWDTVFLSMHVLFSLLDDFSAMTSCSLVSEIALVSKIIFCHQQLV